MTALPTTRQDTDITIYMIPQELQHFYKGASVSALKDFVHFAHLFERSAAADGTAPASFETADSFSTGRGLALLPQMMAAKKFSSM